MSRKPPKPRDDSPEARAARAQSRLLLLAGALIALALIVYLIARGKLVGLA